MKNHVLPAILIGLILIIGIVCAAQAEDQLPAEIQETIHELTVVKTAYWDSPGSTWFVLARTPYGANMLLCFVQEGGSWVRSFYTIAAVPQGEDAVKLLHITKKVLDYENNLTWPGPILIILDRDGNYTSYQRSDSGQWNLFYVFWHEEQVYSDFRDDSITFRIPIDQDHRQSVTVQGTFERDIRNVDINTIPRSPQQAQEMSDRTPAAGQAEAQQETSFVETGSIVTFGHYEQDGNEANGPEPIEWIVLDVQNGSVLLMSRYGLEHLPYHTKDEKVTWESCSLRAWLNSDFLQTAFTPEELESIRETQVDNSKAQCFARWKKAKGGNDTMDRIFLLSYAEANRYLGVSWYGDGSEKAQMEVTDYAAKDAHRRIPGFENPDARSYCHWWLRSPGADQTDASDVTTSGSLVTSGAGSDYPFVRPVLWLDLNAMN